MATDDTTSTPVTPVINNGPNVPKRTWYIGDIYDPTNPASTAQYVPNVDDLIYDYDVGFYRVTAVDYTTGVSTKTPWTLPLSPPSNVDDEDVLLGSGPGTVSDSYRAYFNTAVTPNILDLDHRLHMYGSTTTSVKVFLGTDISDSGTVISKYYDQSGNLLGENIPLELVGTEGNATNTAIKAAKIGYTTTPISDGELLTCVFYDDVGNKVSTAKVLAQNTTNVRNADAATKYITQISLESPFLSPTDPTVIVYPVNMPVASLNLMGVVTYSDGSQVKLPVDGTKFSLFGLDQYIATQEGQTIGVVLSYLIGADEVNGTSAMTLNGRIARQFSAMTDTPDGAYSIKLFVYPVWQSPQAGYRLQYFLYNLDRKSVYDVTSLVEAGGSSTNVFNPTLYGTTQNLTMALQMNTVDPSYLPFRFVQTFQITLLRQGTDQSGDNWTVTYTPGQTPIYGLATKAVGEFVEVGNWNLDLTCGLTDLTSWLAKVYLPTQPLIDNRSESAPPTPNVMSLLINNTRYEFPVSQWNQLLPITTTMVEGDDVFIEWILRDNDNDLQLGVSGLIIHLTGQPASSSEPVA